MVGWLEWEEYPILMLFYYYMVARLIWCKIAEQFLIYIFLCHFYEVPYQDVFECMFIDPKRLKKGQHDLQLHQIGKQQDHEQLLLSMSFQMLLRKFVTAILCWRNPWKFGLQIWCVCTIDHSHFNHELSCVDLKWLFCDSLTDLPQQYEAQITVYHFRSDRIVQHAFISPSHNFLLCIRQRRRVVRKKTSIMQEQIPNKSTFFTMISILWNIFSDQIININKSLISQMHDT